MLSHSLDDQDSYSNFDISISQQQFNNQDNRFYYGNTQTQLDESPRNHYNGNVLNDYANTNKRYDYCNKYQSNKDTKNNFYSSSFETSSSDLDWGEEEILLDLKVEIVIWMEFVRIFSQIQKQCNVTIGFVDNYVNVKGKQADVKLAREQVDRYEKEYVMDLLFRSGVDNYNEMIPYIELVSNQKYLELRKLYPELLVATKKKLQQIHANQKQRGYYRQWDRLKQLPESFVAIFCSKKDKNIIMEQVQYIAKTLTSIIDNKITPFSLPNIDQRGFDLEFTNSYSKCQRSTISKRDFLSVSLQQDLKFLAKQNDIHIAISDHPQDEQLLDLTIYGYRQTNIDRADEILEVAFRYSITVTDHPIKRGQYGNVCQQLYEYLTSNNENIQDQINIYNEDNIIRRANELDQTYGTSILQEISGYLSQLKNDETLLFIQGPKKELPNLRTNTNNFFQPSNFLNLKEIDENNFDIRSNFSLGFGCVSIAQEQEDNLDLSTIQKVYEDEPKCQQSGLQASQISSQLESYIMVKSIRNPDSYINLKLVKRSETNYKRFFSIIQESLDSYIITFFNLSKTNLNLSSIQMDKLNLSNFKFNREDFDSYLTKFYNLAHALTYKYNGRQLQVNIGIKKELHTDVQTILQILQTYINGEMILFFDQNIWLRLIRIYQDNLFQFENQFGCNIKPILLSLPNESFNQEFYLITDKEFEQLKQLVLVHTKDCEQYQNPQVLEQQGINRFGLYVTNMGLNNAQSIIQLFKVKDIN